MPQGPVPDSGDRFASGYYIRALELPVGLVPYDPCVRDFLVIDAKVPFAIVTRASNVQISGIGGTHAVGNAGGARRRRTRHRGCRDARLFRNPPADPGLIGLTSGASLGRSRLSFWAPELVSHSESRFRLAAMAGALSRRVAADDDCHWRASRRAASVPVTTNSPIIREAP
jgi:hypothetical protein